MDNMNKQTPKTAAPTDKKSFADKAGDVIEKVGHKISEAGAPGLGQKIHDLGDKVEKHHSNPAHPHKS